ncbi:MAG: RNA-binding protein [Chitinophagaceae bacterium]|nr:MAG: RNA-binding protein [Chitinophagaceae bacterium]
MSFRQLFLYLLLIIATACNNSSTLFVKLSSGVTGITFNNKIVESDSMNPLDIVNIYNGGGVGVGDFNNDGLQDLYLTGNMVSSKCYLNKGDMKFEDITDASGTAGMGRWARGVAIVDINDDGLSDIYVTNTVNKDSLNRGNILYVNQGVNADGVPQFKDMAREYGLEVFAYSTMANFFDFDNDGDLDVYITVNAASSFKNPSVFNQDRGAGKNQSIGKLYRNDWDSTANHPFFRDVSVQAKINLNGYGHASTICDINLDGWKDIYVSNDFVSANILYINNQDGTFSDQSRTYFKHTSYNSMGQDVIDLNNDGLSDVFELDMSPRDNYRRKMMLNANSYITFQNFATFNYQFQYVRNTLQLNQGPRLVEGDSIAQPVFSEVGFMSGIAQTDWSWTPLITDFDNDGFRDIIVTNGFPKDVTDHDFIAYREQSMGRISTTDLLKKIPEIKLHNYAFRNQDGINFTDETARWGLEEPSYANGAAWADLDNDGDLDMIINNINDEATVYRNGAGDDRPGNTGDTGAGQHDNYLQVTFEGAKGNKGGIGTWVSVYYGDKKQVYENTPYRGYLSTNQNIAHFGLGSVSEIDSLIINWPDGRSQVLNSVRSNQLLKVKAVDAKGKRNLPGVHQSIDTNIAHASLFTEITKQVGIDFKHRDADLIDFNIQTTLPHKLSEYCPALAAGDINGDGIDDLVIGGNENYKARVFFQQANGQFIQRSLLVSDTIQATNKDGGILLFDANGDGYNDLYVVSSGYQYESGSINYQDRLYLNDGKGNFAIQQNALPLNRTSKLCVRSFDYNKDGRPDLFVSGRVDPWSYPKPVSSFIYRNDSEKGVAKFTDVTEQVAPGLKDIGLVCDAMFTDFDNDQQFDLILAGEWMPVTFFKNTGAKFTNVTGGSGLADKFGWWNSIQAGDFRHTGRTDYIIGNVGLNTLYKAYDSLPVYITAKDFDNNGGYEAFPSLMLPDLNGKMAEFPAHGRDDIVDKLPVMKKRFPNYQSIAAVSMNELLTPEQYKDALRLKATTSQSCFLRNDGNGKFTMIPLPQQAQISMLNGMIVDDFNGDGNADVLVNGNDYGTEVSVGRYDALNGLLLLGDGKGGFSPQSIMESGIYIPGNGKAFVSMLTGAGDYIAAASQNQDYLKLFRLRKKPMVFRWIKNDLYAIITYKDGRTEKKERYYGASFLSQSSDFFVIGNNIGTITVFNTTGSRILNYPG